MSSIISRIVTLAVLCVVIIAALPIASTSDAYRYYATSDPYPASSALIVRHYQVGYYDDGVWLLLKTYRNAIVSVDDASWQPHSSWYDQGNGGTWWHLFTSNDRSSGSRSFNATAVQTNYTVGDSRLFEQSKYLSFNISIGYVSLTHWRLSVQNPEGEGRSVSYQEVQDITIYERSYVYMEATISGDRKTGMWPVYPTFGDWEQTVVSIQVPEGFLVAQSTDYSFHAFTCRNLSDDWSGRLGVGTHRFQMEVVYGLRTPDAFLHGETVVIDFNITVLPDPIIVSSPVSDIIDGDYFLYAPESDGRRCQITWNTAYPVPTGMGIHRITQPDGQIREMIYGTPSGPFVLSFIADAANRWFDYQNATVNVHPLLTQRWVGPNTVNEGHWGAILTTTGPANVTFEGLPDSVMVEKKTDTVHHLIGNLSPGTYDITVRAESDYVRTQYSNVTYVINVLPALEFISSPPSEGMANHAWEYSPQLNDANATMTLLDGPDWMSFENGTLSGTPPEPGEYDVSIRGFRGGPYDQTVQEFTVVVGYDGLSPIAAFSTSRHQLTVQFTDRSWGAASWHWDFGDGMNSTERNVTHTYAANGTYTVTLTVTNDHGEDFLTKTFFVKVGMTGEDDREIGPVNAGIGFQWALLLIVPIVACAIGYHRTRNRLLLMALLVLIAMLAVLM